MGKPSYNKNGVWSPSMESRLTDMWAQGLSCSIIAAQLGHGLSRCAVIGKVKRLRLPGRLTASRVVRVYKSTPRAIPQKKTSEPPAQVTLMGEPGEFVEGDNCRFIVGDPSNKDWLMCGNPGFPWCAYHKTIVFDRPRTERAKTREAA